jgi:hypothetical protein
MLPFVKMWTFQTQLTSFMVLNCKLMTFPFCLEKNGVSFSGPVLFRHKVPILSIDIYSFSASDQRRY